MSIKEFKCPNCGASLDYNDNSTLTMRCPYCDSSLVVPEGIRTATASNRLNSVLPQGETQGLEEVMTLARRGNMIEAIKRYRELFGVGLKEAKDAVDQMNAGRAIVINIGGAAAMPYGDQTSIVMEYLRRGQKIEAIKYLRENSNLDLTEAKDAVERIERQMQSGQGPMMVTVVGGDRQPQVVNLEGAKVAGAVTAGVAGCSLVSILLPLLGIGLCVALLFAPLPLASLLGSLGFPDEAIPAGNVSFVQYIIDMAEAGSEPQTSTTTNTDDQPSIFETLLPTTTPGFANPTLIFGTEGTGPGRFDDSRQVAVARDGTIYVAEYQDGRVQSFDAEGNYLSLFRVESELPLKGLAVERDGTVLVVQGGDITRYDPATGAVIGTITTAEDLYFDDVEVTPDGALLTVVDGEDIYRLSPDGEVLLSIPAAVSSQTGDSELSSRVVEDGQGNIFILGRFNGAILKYSREGRFLDRFGGEGDAPGQLHPLGGDEIEVDGQNRLYAVSGMGINVYENDGTFLEEFAQPPVFGLTINQNDMIYVMGSDVLTVYTLREP